MRAIVFLVQLLFWLLVLRFVIRGLARLSAGAGGGGRPAASGRTREIEDLVLDRICHTYLPRSRAVVARVDGREEAFCSSACRDKALAAVVRAS